MIFCTPWTPCAEAERKSGQHVGFSSRTHSFFPTGVSTGPTAPTRQSAEHVGGKEELQLHQFGRHTTGQSLLPEGGRCHMYVWVHYKLNRKTVRSTSGK